MSGSFYTIFSIDHQNCHNAEWFY